MKSFARRVVWALGLAGPAVFAVEPAAAQRTIVFFDFFFGDNAGVPQDDFRNFFQWNVSGGSVDLVGGFGPGVFGAPPNDPRGRYVDLGGSTANPGLFETKLLLDLLPGATYNLEFMYRSTLPGQNNSATVSFGGQTFFVNSSAEQFTTFSESFIVNSLASSRLSFQGLEGDTDGSGLGIDGVLLSVVRLPDGSAPTDPGLPLPIDAVPEPATWATMMLGFGLVGAAARRRKAALGVS